MRRRKRKMRRRMRMRRKTMERWERKERTVMRGAETATRLTKEMTQRFDYL